MKAHPRSGFFDRLLIYQASPASPSTNGPALPGNCATPTAAAEGADWKRFYQFAGDTTSASVNQWSIDVPPGVMHLQVAIADNTGQAVTCEAFLSEVTSAASA